MDNTVFVILRRKSFAIRQGFPGLTTKTRRREESQRIVRVFVSSWWDFFGCGGAAPWNSCPV